MTEQTAQPQRRRRRRDVTPEDAGVTTTPVSVSAETPIISDSAVQEAKAASASGVTFSNPGEAIGAMMNFIGVGGPGLLLTAIGENKWSVTLQSAAPPVPVAEAVVSAGPQRRLDNDYYLQVFHPSFWPWKNLWGQLTDELKEEYAKLVGAEWDVHPTHSVNIMRMVTAVQKIDGVIKWRSAFDKPGVRKEAEGLYQGLLRNGKIVTTNPDGVVDDILGHDRFKYNPKVSDYPNGVPENKLAAFVAKNVPHLAHL